ncbi:metallophosphoesterase [Candidatus Woesearchaeota archaeon]|nr:metallophosphoesterase [Candidatus Woesearchaeota archaeon]
MKILAHIEIVDLGLYFTKRQLLAITDLQFGYEESLNKKGVLVPRFAHQEMLKRMEAMLQHCCILSQTKKINAVLVNGDFKHEFGTISETEWRYCIRFLKLLQTYADTIILVKGNHDTMLDPIAKTRGLEVVDHYILNDVLFVHGDTLPALLSDKKIMKNISTIVIGHEHPAVVLSQWPRSEKYKAFLCGTWKRKKLIVLPSFNQCTEGTDVLKEYLLSPFLKGADLSLFEAFLVADKPYYFGKLGNLKKKTQT